MALATSADVVARLGRDLTGTETARVAGLLDEASALVIGFLGCDPTDTSTEPGTVPPAVSVIVSRMVARLFAQEQAGVDVGSEATTTASGPFSETLRYPAGSTSGAPWLTKTDRLTLRAYRCEAGFAAIPIAGGLSGEFRHEVY